jgi:hypothetical protein
MDIHKLQWDQELLQRFHLSESMLPRICSNAEVYGHVNDGPLLGVPIAGCYNPLHWTYKNLGEVCGKGTFNQATTPSSSMPPFLPEMHLVIFARHLSQQHSPH